MIWPTRFEFAVPSDVAWEQVKAALAPMGGVVTSEDFRTLLIERRSSVDAVEFKLAMRPGTTDETSVLVVEEASVLVEDGRRRRRPLNPGGNPGDRLGPEGLFEVLLRVIQGLDYLRDPLVSALRTEEFRLALKGYNVNEVDKFLDGLADRLERNDALFPEDVIRNEFRTSWKGYNKQDVHDFLRQIAAAIETQSH